MALKKYKQGYHNFNDPDVDDEDYWDDEGGGEDPGWRRAEGLVGKFLGVEYEIEATTGYYMDIINALPEHIDGQDGEPPHLEDDGSLDDDAGIEIIFPPVSPATLRDPKSYFFRAITALDKSGIAEASRRCGMHVNVNCFGWTQFKKGAFVGMIHTMPRAKLEAIGGRTLNHYCGQAREYRTIVGYATSPGDEHVYAVEHKRNGQRLECRFPASTTDIGQIARVSYFLELLEDFADMLDGKEDKPRYARDLYDQFVAWLEPQQSDGAKNVYEVLQAAQA